MNSACAVPGDEGGFTQTCLYCFLNEGSCNCSIEESHQTNSNCDESPCSAGLPGRSGEWKFPGGRVLRDAEFPDLYGKSDTIFANSADRHGLVLYYLGNFKGAIDPVYPEFVGSRCCHWWCAATIHGERLADALGEPLAVGSWRVQCNKVLKGPGGDVNQLLPRPLELVFNGRQRMVFVHLAYAGWSVGKVCFQTLEQRLLTDHPSQDWEHLDTNDADLRRLSTLGVHFEMRMAPNSQRYPHRSTCATFMNDVLAFLEDELERQNIGTTPDVLGLTSPGLVGYFPNVPAGTPNRAFLYNRHDINLWQHVQTWDCPDPSQEDPTNRAIRKRDADGNDVGFWDVLVRTIDSPCTFRALPMLKRLTMELRISAEPVQLQHLGLSVVHMFAQFSCVVDLQLFFPVDLPCEGIRRAFPGDRCDARFNDEDRPFAYTTGTAFPDVVECDHVPLSIEWRGLLGPRPWSAGNWSKVSAGGYVGLIDGLEIPGEANDSADDGAAPQRFAGKVTLLVDEA